MSTRSSISVILKEGTTKIKFNPNLVDYPYVSRWEDDKLDTSLETMPVTEYDATGADVIRCYVQCDGYPSGVGETLITDYNTYEKALNLVLGGPLECITRNESNNGGYTGGYLPCKQMDANSTRPKNQLTKNPFNTSPVFSTEWEYLFNTAEGIWYVRKVRGKTKDILEEIKSLPEFSQYDLTKYETTLDWVPISDLLKDHKDHWLNYWDKIVCTFWRVARKEVTSKEKKEIIQATVKIFDEAEEKYKKEEFLINY